MFWSFRHYGAVYSPVVLGSDFIRDITKAVSSVLVNSLTWGLLLWPWWLKTPSSLPSPCRSSLKHSHIAHPAHTHPKPTLCAESTRWCKLNLVGRSRASQPWSTAVTSAVWWSLPSKWVTSFIQTVLDHQDLRTPHHISSSPTLSLERLEGCIWKKLPAGVDAFFFAHHLLT